MTDTATIRCELCRGILDEEDLFCVNCGREAPRRQDQSAPRVRTFTHKFVCAGCGASMSYDASAQALRCPFCDSVQLEAKPDTTEVQPSRVVTFVIDRERAIHDFQAWLGKGFWRPGNLAQEAAVVTMTAVYVPYWVFAADVHTHWTADTSETPAGARADWYPLAGEHRARYQGLLIGASGALTPAETHALSPFDLSQGKPPDDVDLDNIVVEKFGHGRAYARELARTGLDNLEVAAVTSECIPGRSRNVHVNLMVTGMTSEPVLLPVWILAFRYRGTVYRYLANGQNGRATGHAPTSVWRVLGVVALALLGVAAIGLLMAALFGR